MEIVMEHLGIEGIRVTREGGDTGDLLIKLYVDEKTELLRRFSENTIYNAIVLDIMDDISISISGSYKVLSTNFMGMADSPPLWKRQCKIICYSLKVEKRKLN